LGAPYHSDPVRGTLRTPKSSAGKAGLTEDTRVPWRVQGAVYGAGLFANSSLQLYNVIVPLWAVLLQPTPFMLGLAIGARQFLPMLFSIHGGALMDRLGTRRVMLVCAVVSLVTPPLYVLLPGMWALIALQLVSGFVVIMVWVGAQSMIGEVMRGEPAYAGRLSFATRIGVFAGPPLVGLAWDIYGPWGAFGFMTFWALGSLASTIALPSPDGEVGEAGDAPRPRMRLRALLPNLADYIAAAKLLAVPAIALVVSVSVMRHAGVAVQGSFYVVWVNQMGVTGTAIGTLFSVTGACGGLAALFLGRLARAVPDFWLLVLSVAGCIVTICATPLLGTYLALVVMIGLRGVFTGIAQSMEISLMARSTGRRDQGKGAALRITAGRVAAFFLPVLMGGVVELFGLEMSFYVTGAALLAVLAAVAWRSYGPVKRAREAPQA
jgi:MFS family permease